MYGVDCGDNYSFAPGLISRCVGASGTITILADKRYGHCAGSSIATPSQFSVMLAAIKQVRVSSLRPGYSKKAGSHSSRLMANAEAEESQ
jgi:hypothetical protein